MEFPVNNNSSADTDSCDEFLEYYGQADSTGLELQTPADVESSNGLESPPPAHANMNNRGSGSKINGETEIRQLFECPFCCKIILAPITVCNNGHFGCNSCREGFQHCSSCSAEFTEVRNRLAEDFLDNCLVKCKYSDGGCEVDLHFTELSAHYKVCHYRPLICRECDQEIPYPDFLDHLRNKEILEPQQGAECSTRFQIEDEELSRTYGRLRFSYWEPTWIHAFGQDFFCFLETLDTNWWIWVGGYASPEECEKFVCSITVWNKENRAKKKYSGKVHSIRASPHDVFSSGLCLSFLEVNLKHLMYKGGIDVLVRIDTEDRSGSSKDAKRG